jgi:hypothetical protein
VIEARHEIGRDLGCLLFGDGVRGILLPGFKDIFKCSVVLGAPRYRNSWTENAGVAIKKVIRSVTRDRLKT